MELKFIFAVKVTLFLLCLLVVTILLWNIKKLHFEIELQPIGRYEGKNTMKYILLWTDPKTIPFSDIGEMQRGFVSRNCPYTNCIVTANRSLLDDPSFFDVVVFHGPELIDLTEDELPKKRLPHQKYVFASIESSDYYPICNNKFDGYFNWTWTYKLDSDVRWGYIVVRNSKGKIVGPKMDMNWLDPNIMDSVSSKMKEKLKRKTKAVAWIVSNCITNSRREGFALALEHQLRRHNLNVDIYGNCDNLKCPRENQDKCNKMIEGDYYFYLSFENAFSVDYVTEKLLIALQNNAVPIVYGGANYTRFLPPGSYINARELGPYRLADKIVKLIEEPELYAQYFRWKKYYSYHKTTDSVETNEYCQMCALLNSDKMTTPSVYENFQEWWDPVKPAVCLAIDILDKSYLKS